MNAHLDHLNWIGYEIGLRVECDIKQPQPSLLKFLLDGIAQTISLFQREATTLRFHIVFSAIIVFNIMAK